MDPAIKEIRLSGLSAPYSIAIGDTILSPHMIHEAISGAETIACIVNETVQALHQKFIYSALGTLPSIHYYIMKDGEQYKSYRDAEKALEWMLHKGYNRKSALIAIGGGVVGDFAGFIASVYMRGIPLVHVPTTLMSMVDSSIGGKVAVNISRGKNIVGTFHQPALVISDISFLRTLPRHEFKNGLAETVKHALIGERELLELLLQNDPDSIMQPHILERMVHLSARFKASIVEQDEREMGLRAILNFGHTIGHGVESFLDYRGISHGQAVALGLELAMEISRLMGMISDDEMNHFIQIMNKYQLIYRNKKLDAATIIEHMKYDKKNQGGDIKFVLLKGIGNALYNQRVPKEIIKDAFKIMLNK